MIRMTDAYRGLYGLALPDLRSDGARRDRTGALAPMEWSSAVAARRSRGRGRRLRRSGIPRKAPPAARLKGAWSVDRQSRSSITHDAQSAFRRGAGASTSRRHCRDRRALGRVAELRTPVASSSGEACGEFSARREVGKSSLLAALAGLGVDAMKRTICSSFVQGCALAGPRCIDLREGSARTLGVGKTIGLVGTRERWRLHLEPSRLRALPLAGWVTLEWGETMRIFIRFRRGSAFRASSTI